MNLTCTFGFHKWTGCKCSACAKTRNEGHDWSKDCEKCARCGAARASAHRWAGCKCSACGKTRDAGHDWSKDCEKCARCGAVRADTHKWTGCKCSVCNKTRDESHDWSKDCEKCARCGAARASAHQWTGCKCSACGKTRNEGHDWSKDCEKCSRCGAARTSAHKWAGPKCSVCGKTAPPDKFPSGEQPVGWVRLPCIDLPRGAGKVWDAERGYRLMLLLVRLPNNLREVHFKFSDFQLESPNGRTHRPIGLCCSLTAGFRAAIGQLVPFALTTSEAHLEQWTDHYGVLFAVDDREQEPGRLEAGGRIISNLPQLPVGGELPPAGKVDTRIRALATVVFKDLVPFANERGALEGFHELVNPSRQGILAIGHREFNVFETAPTEKLTRKQRSIVVVRIPDEVGSLADGLDTDRMSATLQDGSVLECVGLIIPHREQYDPKPIRMVLSKGTLTVGSPVLKANAVASFERELVCPITSYSELERKAVMLFDERLTVENLASVRINDYEARLESGALFYKR